MSTKAQISANQANSQNSTGPQTEVGKSAASQNSWKHGLSGGEFTVLSTESYFKYHELMERLIAEHQPAKPTESILVERMAQHHWLRNRALHFQTKWLETAFEVQNLDTKLFALFQRYQTTHERAFSQCLQDLLKLRAEKQKHEIGSVSQSHKQELHIFNLLRHQAEADYQKNRADRLKYDVYLTEKRLKEAIAREETGEAMQKAA